MNHNEQPTYPTGLEVVWRQVPIECQHLITPWDVPQSARNRGYFTVAELLALKRLLISRLTGMPDNHQPIAGATRTKRSKMMYTTYGQGQGPVPNYGPGPPPKSCRCHCVEYASAASTSLAVDEVRGAVKEALGILDESQNNSGEIVQIHEYPEFKYETYD